MMTHSHLCSECDLEWACYGLDCVGVHEMFCDECALEYDLAEDDLPENQVPGGKDFPQV